MPGRGHHVVQANILNTARDILNCILLGQARQDIIGQAKVQAEDCSQSLRKKDFGQSWLKLLATLLVIAVCGCFEVKMSRFLVLKIRIKSEEKKRNMMRTIL